MTAPTPRFSICTPVHDPPVPLLRACLASITSQTSDDWELCLVDDGSSDPEVLAVLREAAAGDPRVHLRERPASGGISVASNDALDLARGEFVVLVDHDDTIEPDALSVVDAALRADPEIDYLYTDEDKVRDGVYFDQFYKPAWSPERLRSQNYCAHLSVLRRALVEEVGRFRTGYEGSQDHDLILRVTERCRRVHHVPQVLYHWWVSEASAASTPDAKPHAREAGRRAVADHLTRLGIEASVEHLPIPGHFRSRRALPEPPPRVSVVIPTAGSARRVWGAERPMVLGAVTSLLDATTYPDVEVVVVVDPATPPPVGDELGDLDVTLLAGDAPFNYSRRCNQGVAASTGEVIVLLNDDTYVEQHDWIEVMLGFLAEPDIGMVGARLCFADGRLQHAGVLLNAQPLHIFHGYPADHPGPFGLLQIDREVSAVTAACAMIRRDLYEEVGGLDEDFAVAFNDLDLCLRLRQLGRRIVWTPHATLYHFESSSRPLVPEQHEVDMAYTRWHDQLFVDPYGNPHLAPKQAEWRPALRYRAGPLLRRIHPRFRVAPPLYSPRGR